ncbi:MAG: Na+/H+ antiporter subunit E, partial [Thermodesulfobacteriota bacterium]
LLGFWLLLSGQTDWADSGDRYLMACGVFSCALVTYLAIRKEILDEEGHPIHLASRFLAYIPWLLWQIVLANLDVAYRVWHPRRKISPRLIRVPFRTQADIVTVTYANSITLTPGTITISVDQEKRELLVHTLSEEAARWLLSGQMHERVMKLEASE